MNGGPQYRWKKHWGSPLGCMNISGFAEWGGEAVTESGVSWATEGGEEVGLGRP